MSAVNWSWNTLVTCLLATNWIYLAQKSKLYIKIIHIINRLLCFCLSERWYLSSETLYFSSSWLPPSHLPLRFRTYCFWAQLPRFASARIKLQAERVTQFLGLDWNGNFSNPSGHVGSRIADNTNIGSYNRSSLRMKDRKCLSHHARTESPDPEYFHMHYFVKDNISLSFFVKFHVHLWSCDALWDRLGSKGTFGPQSWC